MHWDVFCRVVDNYGDIGVCWRLAADLGARAQAVRLWVDDATALSWMAPAGASGVQVLHWKADAPVSEPGDVVVEAFGCDPPLAFVERMACRSTPPLWINLEYLSAEAYVRRSHGLRSPQLAGPGKGLDKWFFYPGFEPGTGGVIREAGLMDERSRFDARRWIASRGFAVAEGERLVSVFCYAGAPVAGLLRALAGTPTVLLATPGAASQALQPALARHGAPDTLRCIAMPWLSQADYDRLLWACDLNVVRGEDSFVRAQWAGAPFIWQAYPQLDGAHAAKVEAFLRVMLQGADEALAATLQRFWLGWNGLADTDWVLPEPEAWRAHALRWRSRLLEQPDLSRQLLGFVAERR